MDLHDKRVIASICGAVMQKPGRQAGFANRAIGENPQPIVLIRPASRDTLREAAFL